MSRETLEWLNTQTLVGFTSKRKNAWHYRRELQGIESNHYVDAIPVEDVLRRLFCFNVIEAPVFYQMPDGRFVPSSIGRKGMLRDDTEYDLGAFKAGYQGHQYQEWLLENVATILDDELGIGSAGLLRMGAQAWVSVEVPENIVTPEGVEFRPNLFATTSFDGSLATTYKRVVTDVVCDNTRDMALAEDGQEFKVKHTKHSGYRINDARQALHIVHDMGDKFAEEVARLTAWKVSDEQFDKHLKIMVPITDELAKVGITKAENKRAEIINLYNFDNRCAPWHGTAYGVLQTYNTWGQHNRAVKKGVQRVVRNMENLLTGKTGQEDRQCVAVLTDICK